MSAEMKNTLVESKLLRDGYRCVKHASGLTVFIYPKAEMRSTYAVFGTRYGSIDKVFKRSDECFEHENCEVQLEGVEEEDHYVILVRDFWEGMSEEDLVRVFEPFVRLEHSRSRKTGGTGLGLSIARNLARLNNADITLSNAHPGLLATVRISKAGCLAGSAK